jgi:osmotically-inducible protein OsmY
MRILFVPWIAATLLITSCSQEDRNRTAVAGNADTSLEQAIQASFTADPQLQNSGLSVTANADKSEAVVSGTVTSEESRSKAVALAKEVKPGLQVIDMIKVKPAELARSEYTEVMARRAQENALVLGNKVGNSLDDAWLYTKVTTRLTTNSGSSALKINVDVKDKVVTLRGRVDSESAKDEAERIAKETDGVKNVNNLIEVHRVG